MPARARPSTEPPAGWHYRPDFITAAEETELLTRLVNVSWGEVRMHGVVAKRDVAHFGWDYGYESWALTPAPPLPQWLEPLRARAAALVSVPPDAFAEILITRYPPGASIGWHRDAPMFGPVVVGVSLGAPCVMRFRRGPVGERMVHQATLEPRSAYVLAGEARRSWQHSTRAVSDTRHSITFRTVLGRGRA